MSRSILLIAVTAVLLSGGAETLFAQDLTIEIKKCPRSVTAGRDLNSSFRVTVSNNGDAEVKNVPVEIILKKDTFCPVPARRAMYSPEYFDGVLLRGGRESVSVAPGKSVAIPLHGANTIPQDTPVGRTYFLCAVVDAGDTIKESNEQNNCACCPVKVTGAEERPEISGYAERCIKRLGTLTIQGRNFGSQAGKAVFLTGTGISVNLRVMSWSDSIIIAGIPDDPNIRAEQRYFVGIRKTDTAEWLSNARTYVTVCPGEKPPEPREVPPIPPFLH